MIRTLLALLLSSFVLVTPAQAQGTLTLALQQQINANGQPLVGALLYTYVVGTVAQPQNTYQDFGLTHPNPWPLTADSNGRFPMFYVAAGNISVRVTDALGNQQLYAPSTIVLGAAGGGGGGGGGGSVDPTTLFQTGDIKFRMSAEALSEWVVLNGQTIGNATSGASGFASATAQNLYIYLWTNCSNPSTNTLCAVSSGLGSSALNDFNANKTLTLPDLRDAALRGRDCMGNTCKTGLFASQLTHGTSVDEANANGGVTFQFLSQANLPNVNFSVNIPSGQGSHTHTLSNTVFIQVGGQAQGTSSPGQANAGLGVSVNSATLPGMSGTANSGGSGSSFNTLAPFYLGTWYIHL